MFLTASSNPTAAKRLTYLVACVLLGVLLSLLVHAGVEALYLAWAESTGRTVIWYGGCALHPVIQGSFLVLGVLGGHALGRFWWRKVYVDRVWAGRKS